MIDERTIRRVAERTGATLTDISRAIAGMRPPDGDLRRRIVAALTAEGVAPAAIRDVPRENTWGRGSR